MSPESMDSQGRGEYDRPKRRRLTQFLGEFVARHLIQGDESVARSGHDEDLDEALAVALEAEYSDAIWRAQAFLVAIKEGRLPAHLAQEADLPYVDEDDLRDVVLEWCDQIGAWPDAPLESLRLNTEACAYHREAMATDSQLEFSSQVRRAEIGLILTLREAFGDEGVSA